MTQEFKKYSKPLEFDKICEKLSQYASCEGTRIAASKLTWQTDFDDVQQELNRTVEAHSMIARFGSPSVYGIRDISSAISRAKAGGVLSMREVLDIGELLKTSRLMSEYYNHPDNNDNFNSSISDLFYFLYSDKHLENRIFMSIISEDEMDDNASSQLFEIRRKIKNSSSKIRDILNGIVKSPNYQKYLQEAIITIRDGRFVIPVKAEHRGEIRGLVHDTSSSGATLFVEPMSVVDANNDIKILQAEEEKEILKILSIFSEEISTVATQLTDNYKYIIEIDLCFSKARMAYDMKASKPILNNNGIINLKKARHPLISKDNVVPIDINLGENFDTLMITGPNTGGKTVALKTLGLLSLMAMAGLMIPADENSQVSIFDKILADIGDEQSIEQSLSTFSAHITNIIKILDIADNRSLVLLDELGAGTDPVEGAALARSILERLRALGSKIAATTHYAELKIFALETPNVENASCEFDLKTLSPTYKLLIGTPGRSNAFAISERLGISSDIVGRAKDLVSSDKTRFEDVVSSLEEERQALELERKNMIAAKEEAERKLQDAKEKTKNIDVAYQREIDKAQAKAKTILENVQIQTNQLIEELNRIRKQKDKEEFRLLASKAKASVDSKLDSISNEINSIKGNHSDYKLPRPLREGDIVTLVDINQKGTVLSPPDSSGMVFVQAGIIKTKVKVSALRLENRPKITANHNQPKQGNRIKNKEKNESREINVMGQNVEEAIIEIDKFLDNTYFSNVNIVTIIHGKGTGALRTGIHQFLKRHRRVKSYRLGTYGEGESGVTIIELN